MSTSIKFALIGDAEPKPQPVFAGLTGAVAAINRLHVDFTASIGDLAHRGTKEQYEALTGALQLLQTPFYAIMGNEELCEGEEQYLHYAARWNHNPRTIPGLNYTVSMGDHLFVFATAKNKGLTFSLAEAAWIMSQVENHDDKWIFLFTHAAAPGIFPEAGHRQMGNDLLTPVLAHPQVLMHFSGHTHFDLQEIPGHVVDEHGVHHIHVPGIERTKIGGEHVPRLRVVEIRGEQITVQVYNVATDAYEENLTINIKLPVAK